MRTRPTRGTRELRMRRFWTALALAGLGATTACTSPSAPAHAGGPSGRASAASSSAAARAPATPTARTRPGASRAASAIPAPPPPPPAPRVTVTRTRTADGSVVTVAVIQGHVTYVLHNGSQAPGLAAGRVRAGPVVAGAERTRLLAAFNGGFKLSAGVGGYEQEGRVASPLRRGLASLVIDRSGQARIGVWGHGVPAAAAADWGLWGATLGGGEYVARSALGQNASGDLEYAASMSATPADLALALARDGARIAMELDINPEWVQLDIASHPGGPLRAAVRGQFRPADQFLAGWTRDFIAVLVPPAPPAPVPLPHRPPP